MPAVPQEVHKERLPQSTYGERPRGDGELEPIMESLAEWKRYLIPPIKFSLVLRASAVACMYCRPDRWIDSRHVFIKGTYVWNAKNIRVFSKLKLGRYVGLVCFSAQPLNSELRLRLLTSVAVYTVTTRPLLRSIDWQNVWRLTVRAAGCGDQRPLKVHFPEFYLHALSPCLHLLFVVQTCLMWRPCSASECVMLFYLLFQSKY